MKGAAGNVLFTGTLYVQNLTQYFYSSCSWIENRWERNASHDNLTELSSEAHCCSKVRWKLLGM